MVRASRYRYQDPIERWQRSLIWRGPERIDDASDYYRRDLAGGDDEITMEDIEGPAVFKRRIDQQPLRPKDIPNDMLGRNPFQQAGLSIGFGTETEAERNARLAAQEAEWRDYQRQQAGPPDPFDMVRPERPPGGLPGQQDTQSVSEIFGGGPGPVSPQSAQSTADIFNGPTPPLSGVSISDRVRGGNRYTNMSKRDRDALNLTIAGELAPSSYGTPGGDQEVANMVETITTRAAQKGKSIEDTVKEDWQYSPWNTLDDQADMRERFKEHAPDVRRMVSNAVSGNVVPTHEGLTSYHATRMPGTGQKPDWARGIEPSARAGKHSFYTDIAPWSSSPAGPPLPGNPLPLEDRAITSQDLPEPPPPAPPPMAATGLTIPSQPPAAAATGITIPSQPPPMAATGLTIPSAAGPPPPLPPELIDPNVNPSARRGFSPTSQLDSIDQTLGTPLPPAPSGLPASVRENIGGVGIPGMQRLPIGSEPPPPAPQPLTPEQVAAGQQRVNEMLDPALEAARNVPPALAPDTRYDPLSAATLSSTGPPPPLGGSPDYRIGAGIRSFDADPAVQDAMEYSRELQRGRALGGLPNSARIPAPMPGVDMSQGIPLTGSARPAPVQSQIVQPPLGPFVDQTLRLGQPPASPLTAPLPRPRPDIAAPPPEEEEAVEQPAVQAPAPPPLPPAVTVPNRVVTPAAPLQQEQGDQPVQPSVGPRTGLEGYGQYQGATERSRKPGFFGRFDREHFVGGPGLTGPLDPMREQLREGGGAFVKNAAKGGRGDYKQPLGYRTAGRVGGWTGGILGGLFGGPLGIIAGNRAGTGLGKLTAKAGWYDPNRGWIDSRRKRDKDKDEEKKAQILDKVAKDASGSGGGNIYGGGGSRGSDSGYGGNYSGGGSYGYGGYDPDNYGGGYINQGIGGAYRNR